MSLQASKAHTLTYWPIFHRFKSRSLLTLMNRRFSGFRSVFFCENNWRVSSFRRISFDILKSLNFLWKINDPIHLLCNRHRKFANLTHSWTYRIETFGNFINSQLPTTVWNYNEVIKLLTVLLLLNHSQFDETIFQNCS